MWRPMTQGDLATVSAIAAEVHPDYPEDASVFEERLRLYPAGCHVYADGAAVTGYILSHPWIYKEPPALNVALGKILAHANTYYIHDLALLGKSRGQNAADAILKHLIETARQSCLTDVSLIAVNDSAAFWHKLGFDIVQDAALGEKLRSYDEKARFMRLVLAN